MFVGYFEDNEALQEESEPDSNDPRIPIPPRAPKGEGTKEYVLPKPVPEVDSMLSKVKQETQEPIQNERPLESERLTASGIIEIVEHDPIVFFRGSSIPLSTDFAERVLRLITNQMGPAPSRFRNDNQEQETRTIANENENASGSTNDPNPKLTVQVSTKENVQPKTDLPTISVMSDLLFHPIC